MDGLVLMSQILEQPLGKMLEPHQKLIAEFVPPKAPKSMKAYQMTHQMALLEANRFFLNITPPVASYDQNVKDETDVIMEILEFLKLDDELLQKFQCFDFRQYYPLSFLPYRIAAFRKWKDRKCVFFIKIQMRKILKTLKNLWFISELCTAKFSICFFEISKKNSVFHFFIGKFNAKFNSFSISITCSSFRV